MDRYRLGEWDLGDLISNPAGTELEDRIKTVQNRVKRFQKTTLLKPTMSQAKFLKIIRDLEAISKDLSVIGGFASLKHAADTQSDQAASLLSRTSKLGADMSNNMLFFDLWWKNTLDEKNASRLIRMSGDLGNYFKYKRLIAKYSLSEPEERIINTLDVTGVSALVRLYDRITGAFEYVIGTGKKKKKLTREELSSLVRSKSANTRQSAYQSLLSRFSSDIGVLGELYRNIVLNWSNEGVEIRGYNSPISMRNIANDIDDKTISSLLDTCKKNSSVFRDFFSIKAKLLGDKKLRRYDLYAPARRAEKNYTYDQAVRLVLESLDRFSPELYNHAKSVFEKNHVDSSVRPGKRDGAFCSTLSPDITPYVLLSFTGKSRDVFTLAHELGHAIHGIAASKNSILVQDAPLPLAETASTFSELLLYDNISDSAGSSERQAMLVEKLDDFYATILRQSYFTIFEMDAHDKITNKSATIDEISDAYMYSLKEQFGSSVDLTDDFGSEWSCIPHFYHSPFYCYAYSFGNLLALSLFQRFKKEGKSFISSYVDILSAGGSEKPESLLLQHGMDITSRAFWQDGFDYIKSQADELSKLSN